MPRIQIGKYDRPGIYQEEYDDSLIESSEVRGIKTMIIGSSKKGPVNTPVTLKSQYDLEKVFGDIDRNLESKGSYFHRTISKVLGSSPVVAINLLNPDDNLDKLEYKSLSTASGYVNDIKREGPYRRFFNTSGFWEKDREAFLSLASDNPNDNQRALHLVNLNDKEITVFIIKSKIIGYDISLLEWYGSINKVPFYLNSKDYASDYMVDVYVLDGNWTNYDELSIDPIWSEYFNNDGIIKDKLEDLSRNSAVNTLYVWSGLSLIPYFRDKNGENIFIEHKINYKTEITGLYCAFDMDAVETNYRNGLLDLVGNSLISNNDIEEIEFLSYKEDITDITNYQNTYLDTPGNVYQLTYTDYYQNNTQERTAFNAEGYVSELMGPSDISDDGSYPSTVGYGTYSFDYITLSSDAYAIVGGEKVGLSDTTFEFIPNDFTTSSTITGTTQSFREVFFIDSDGVIKKDPSNTQLSSGIVLGYADFVINHDASRVKYFESIDYTSVSVDDNGFVYFDNTTDIVPTVNALKNEIKYEFLGTSGSPDIHDYKKFRLWKVYNQMVSTLDNTNSYKSTILIDEGSPTNGNPWKKSVNDLTITIESSSIVNKSIIIGGFEDNFLNSSILEVNGLVLHIIDNELIIGSNGLLTTNDYASATQGVVGVYNELYQDYISGKINTGDKFYENLIDGSDVLSENTLTWIKFIDDSGNDYIVTDAEVNFNTNDVILIPESTLNKDKFTVINPTPVDLSVISLGGLTSGYAYQVSENTISETLNNPTKIYNTSESHYLRFYVVDDILTVDFMGESLSGSSTTYNLSLDIVSQNSNFRQSIEVEFPSGYIRPNNVVLVDGSRYTEVKIGDFLEADVDLSNLEVGEVPRKMTRILSKKQYSGDTSLVEITCDSSIKLYDYNGDYQTYRFTQIDDYVSTYKGISLYGFRVRKDSMPNGEDQRIDDILEIISKGTPLYNAITDKDIIDFRYLVDSYGLGLTANSKQTLADICGSRLDTFGILNMPSMKQFRKSSSPKFTDDEGRLSTEFISLGGDPESSPAYTYSLADGDGVSCVGYFTPYVIVDDNGRPNSVPPAAWVATSFLRKHNSALTSVTPWTIVAGINNGQIQGISDLEYRFNGEDIRNLNLMKVNPIVSKRNRGKGVIETENTAQKLAKSSLSYIHAREVLIELERELSDMLLNFQWKYNTPDVRAEIKLRADAICENYVTRNGLYNFFNKIDSENNTQTIIDNQMGVLDTYVEVIKGLSVIVNNITILKTGSINSGGFI